MGNHLEKRCPPEWKAGDQPGHPSLHHKKNADMKERFIFQRTSHIYKPLSCSHHSQYRYSRGGWSPAIHPRASQFTWTRYCTYIYSLKISKLTNFYRRVFNIHWLSLFGRVFSLSFSNMKYFLQPRGYNSEGPLGQCNEKLRGLWAPLRSGNSSEALKGKQRWAKSRHQWLKAYRVWLFSFKNLKGLIY